MSLAQTTRYCALGVVTTGAIVTGWGACPHAQQADTPGAAAQRLEAIARHWREAEPAPLPFVAAERVWTLTLPSGPSAPGDMDAARVYVALRQGALVALDRETGRLEWAQPIEVSSPITAGDGAVFVVAAGHVRALDPRNGVERWATPLAAPAAAPLWSNALWLIAITEAGRVTALSAADGRVVWSRDLGAPSSHVPAVGGTTAYLSLTDGRLVALALTTGEPLWEQRVPGTLSPPAVARDRVFVGSTDNFFYAFAAANGRPQWQWRNGGDVIGAVADEDLVYFASLDNVIRAVNRGNGNQRWQRPTGTRPTAPPRVFGGTVLLPGLMPALTVFTTKTGDVMGTLAAAGDLVGPPLVDPHLKPFSVAIVTITREGVVEALRPAALVFRDAAPVPLAALPGRPLARERLE